MFLSPNPTALDYRLRHVRLVVPFNIVGDAVPADKVIDVQELKGVFFLRTEGQTSIVDSFEDLSQTNFTTPDDDDSGDSIFGVFIKGSNGVSKVKKLLFAEIKEDGTSLSSNLSVVKKGNNNSGVSVDGNICLDIIADDVNLSSDNPSFVLFLDLLIENQQN
jgi:hypothetical protein